MKKELKNYIVDKDDFDPRNNIAACVYGPPTTYFFHCPKCGNEWKSFMTAKKICPECGAECNDFTTDDD